MKDIQNYRNRLKAVEPRTKILNPGIHKLKTNKQTKINKTFQTLIYMNTKEFTLSIQRHVDAELGGVRLLKVSESIKLLQLIIGKLNNGTLNTKGKTSKGI